MKLQIVLGCAAALLLAASCKNPVPQELPIVQTGEVVVSDSGVVLYGRIVQAGMAEIESYGFSIDTSANRSYLLQASSPLVEGVFSFRLEGFYDTRRTYYFYAYVRTKDGREAYGNEVSFRLDSPPLSGPEALFLSSFSPASVPIRGILSLEGGGFDPLPSLNEVFVDVHGSRFSLDARSASYQRLDVQVPASLPIRGKARLGVKRKTEPQQIAWAPGLLDIAGPKIDSISPAEIHPGEIITLSTQGLPFISACMIVNLSTRAQTQFQPLSFDPITGKVTAELPHETPSGLFAFAIIVREYQRTYAIYAPDTLSVNELFWESGGAVPGPFSCQSVAFAAGDHAYVLISGNGGELSKLWRYDPSTSEWTQMPDCPFYPREDIESFQLDGKAYLAGRFGVLSGGSWMNRQKTISYDPATGAWADLAPLPAPIRERPLAFSYNDKGYWGGGRTFTGNVVRDLWRYDPAQDAWTNLAPAPAPPILPYEPVRVAVVNGVPYFSGDIYRYRMTPDEQIEQQAPKPYSYSGLRHALPIGDQILEIFDHGTTLLLDPVGGSHRQELSAPYSARYAFAFGRRACLMLAASRPSGSPSPQCYLQTQTLYYDF